MLKPIRLLKEKEKLAKINLLDCVIVDREIGFLVLNDAFDVLSFSILLVETAFLTILLLLANVGTGNFDPLLLAILSDDISLFILCGCEGTSPPLRLIPLDFSIETSSVCAL